MVVPPTPGQEDRRRISHERAILMRERIRHVNRMKGLLAGQGIADYDPLSKDRRARLETMETGDGQSLPDRRKAELSGELDVIELLMKQIAEVSAESEVIAVSDEAVSDTPVALLARLKGMGPQIASVLWLEGFWRPFSNRRKGKP